MNTIRTRRRSALLLATLAASIGTLASPAAHAAVVTKTLNLTLTDAASTTAAGSKTTTLDVNGDGANDFSFTHSTSPVASPSIGGGADKVDYNGKLTLDAATASQFLAVVKDNDALAGAPANYAETIAVGATVGASNTFVSLASATYDDRLLDSSGSTEGGAFSAASGEVPSSLAGSTLYVGFAFGNAATPNYGYLQFTNVGDDSLNNTTPIGDDLNGATLAGVAYETTPGVAITVAPLAVPEPASLAVAGLASVTLSRRRRRFA